MPTGEPAGSIPNVGLFRQAIKGKLVRSPAIASGATQSSNKASVGLACPPDKLRASLLEQLVRGTAVAGGVDHMLLDAGDFSLEQLNPDLQLVDRQRAKVLFADQGQRVLRPTGKEVILIHAPNR